MANEPSAAETVIKPTETPAPAAPKTAETPAAPAPKTVIKDEKWLDTEISRHEDELHQLRQLKKTASPAPAKAAKVKRAWGTVLDESEA